MLGSIRPMMKRVAVQAGGHVGCWPVVLARHFDVVYTWEPAAADFRDLIYNVQCAGLTDKVFAARGLLGSTYGLGTIFGPSGSTKRQTEKRVPGKNQITTGGVPVYQLDDLELPMCDLIYLDVEGCELDVLKGAMETLQRCRPVVACEEHAKFVTVGALGSYLERFGYEQVGSHGLDVFFEYRGDLHA